MHLARPIERLKNMPIQINTKFYVSPKEAFEIVGQESYGLEWDNSFIEKPESEQFKICLRNLYKAFESGEVSIFTTYGNGSPRQLEPVATRGYFFEIDLKRNVVMNEQTTPHGEYCEINVAQLREFIRRHDLERAVPLVVNKKEAACRSWLIDVMSSPAPVARKPQLMEYAQTNFKIGPALFNRIWKAAIIKTGRIDLQRSGRPKNHNLNNQNEF